MNGRNKIRNVKLIGSTCVLLWGFDKYFNYSTFQRNIRTFYTGAIITLDYKLNFNKEKANEINDLHERTARRILNLCKENGGLYIKFGQQMATVPVLPPPYLRNLRELYDQALCFDYKTVEKIFMKEFGLKPTEIFSSFDETPIASASIAQVHKAILKSGEEVAVKIQKPEIEKQIWFDMLAYRIVLKSLEYFFELPLYWTADYIEKHLVQEVDFVNELNNSEKCHLHILEKPKLASKCYVPKVFQDYSSMRIMTTEWISGASLSDPKEVEKLGFSKSAIMTDVINVFSDQLFRTGFVHCDPHPGNILIRKHPNNVGHQVVILDHGLYIQCRPEFTRQYALFWKSLFSLDIDTTRIITESWGLENAEIFASATLARPWKSGKAIHVEKVTAKDIYDSQVDAKRKVSEFLKNTDKLPKELIFVGRNLNCVRSNNKLFGSPVNRVMLLANYAVECLTFEKPPNSLSNPFNILFLVQQQSSYLVFHSTMFLLSISYHISNIWQDLKHYLLGTKRKGFETILDETMKQQFEGMNFDPSVFDG